MLTVERVQYERAEAIHDTVTRNANVVLGFEEYVVGIMKTVDQRVLLLKHQYEQYGLRTQISNVFPEPQLADPLIAAFAVVDEHGYVLFRKSQSARIQVADRDYFKIHQQQNTGRIFIGAPIKGDLSEGSWFIPVSRRINRPDGSFHGVAMVGIDAAYFMSFYPRINLGREGMILLAGLDGVPIALREGGRYSVGEPLGPVALFAAMTNAGIDNVQARGSLDGILRYVSYRTMVEYPLILAVGYSQAEALAPFNRRAAAHYTAAAVATALLLVAALMLVAAQLRHRRATQVILSSEARFRAIFEQATAGIVRSNLAEGVLEVNDCFCRMTGYSEAELIGKRLADITHAGDRAKSDDFRRALIEAEHGSAAQELEKRYIRKDGAVLWVVIAASVVRNREGRPDYLVTVIQDITQRKRIEQALQDTEEQFQQLAEHVPEAFWITDLKRHAMIYVSPAFERIHGARLRSMCAAWRAWKDTLHPQDRNRVLEAHRTMACGPSEIEYRIVRPDGAIRWVRACGYPVKNARGVIYRVAGTIEDITDRRELENRLQYQAHFDSLTGLPNRILFFDRLTQALAQARRASQTVALLYVDIDRFKVVNDTLGHIVGDKLLQHVAQCLLRSVRAEDTVARLGGDEFAIVLPHVERPESAALIAEKALRALAEPLQLESYEVLVTGSVGVAVSSSDGVDAQTLVKNADAAMFRAKNSGRNAYEFYTSTMNERALEQLELERRLRRALERNEFVLHFQAKTNVATRQLTGYESLLRWSGEGGIVQPSQFVPLLEESGLIMHVGEWVIRAACRQIAEWQRAGHAPVPVAVNISAKQFNQRNLAVVIESALRENGVDGNLLEIELTESTAMQNADEAIVVLSKLKALGVRVAIDDFGTGHSSLSYLKRLPIDVLKIDRSFITGLPFNDHDVSITKAIITMAHNLGIKVVAEGVENEQQLIFLAENGCDEAQGFLFARPVSAHDIGRVGYAQRSLPHPSVYGEAVTLH
jgi:diguanylate cyclase (GGDEF)-like protein/PAS domain S-box-containing protein